MVSKAASLFALLGALSTSACYKPVPGDVLRDERSGGLFGDFRIVSDLFNGIPSNRIGGACLVASAADLQVGPENCQLDSDCKIPRAYDPPMGSGLPRPSSWYGYCDRKEGKCWYRPGTAEALCNRSIDHISDGKPKAWEEGQKHLLPKIGTFDDRQIAAGRRIAWRVHACLNERSVFGGVVDKGCGETDHKSKMVAMGTPKPIDPR